MFATLPTGGEGSEEEEEEGVATHHRSGSEKAVGAEPYPGGNCDGQEQPVTQSGWGRDNR